MTQDRRAYQAERHSPQYDGVWLVAGLSEQGQLHLLLQLTFMDTVNKQSLDGQSVESTVPIMRVMSSLHGPAPTEGEMEKEGTPVRTLPIAPPQSAGPF